MEQYDDVADMMAVSPAPPPHMHRQQTRLWPPKKKQKKKRTFTPSFSSNSTYHSHPDSCFSNLAQTYPLPPQGEPLPIRFLHAAGEATGLPAESADLVSICLVCHELPRSATKKVNSNHNTFLHYRVWGGWGYGTSSIHI